MNRISLALAVNACRSNCATVCQDSRYLSAKSVPGPEGRDVPARIAGYLTVMGTGGEVRNMRRWVQKVTVHDGRFHSPARRIGMESDAKPVSAYWSSRSNRSSSSWSRSKNDQRWTAADNTR